MDALKGFGLKVKRALSAVPPDRLAALQRLSTQVFAADGMQVRQLRKSDALGPMLQWTQGMRKPEVMFIGQSNAGKSTVLSMLCEKRPGGTSGLIGATTDVKMFGAGNMAGKTTCLHRYSISRMLNVIDTPGYGFAASKSRQDRNRNVPITMAHNISLVKHYMAVASSTLLHRVYLVTPVSQGRIAPLDAEMLDVCRDYGLSCAVVLSKVDQSSPTDLTRTVLTIQDQVPDADIIPVTRESYKSVTDLRLDVLHAATKWLPVEELGDAEELRGFEYNVEPPPVDTIEAIMNRYPRPITTNERNSAMARAQGLAVDPTLHRAQKLSDMRAEYLDELHMQALYRNVGRRGAAEAPARKRTIDMSELAQPSARLDSMFRTSNSAFAEASKETAAAKAKGPPHKDLTNGGKGFTDQKTDAHAEGKRMRLAAKRKRDQMQERMAAKRDPRPFTSMQSKHRRVFNGR